MPSGSSLTELTALCRILQQCLLSPYALRQHPTVDTFNFTELNNYVPHRHILRSFKILIYLILEIIYTTKKMTQFHVQYLNTIYKCTTIQGTYLSRLRYCSHMSARFPCPCCSTCCQSSRARVMFPQCLA